MASRQARYNQRLRQYRNANHLCQGCGIPVETYRCRACCAKNQKYVNAALKKRALKTRKNETVSK
jgi:hypothetical protein